MSPTRLLLAVAAALLLLVRVHADFDEDDIERKFTLRIGNRNDCGKTIEFDEESFTQRAGDIKIEDNDCEGGTLTVSRNPKTNPSPAVAFLLAENDAGNFLAGTIDNDLVCDDFTLAKDVELIFVEPEDDFDVEWATFFDGPSGIETDAEDSDFEFDHDTRYVIIGSSCLYSATTIADTCFPASASATLRSGHQVRMNSLHTGDEVLVGAGLYSPIIAWTHQDATSSSASYTRLRTASGHAFVATDSHYVYADGRPMQTGDVRKGMTLRTGAGTITTVTSVESVAAKGLYNPQTAHGDIVVNGIVSSTYTATVLPAAAHALLAPVRAIFRAVKAVFPDASVDL